MTYRDDLDTGQGAKLYKDFLRGDFFRLETLEYSFT